MPCSPQRRRLLPLSLLLLLAATQAFLLPFNHPQLVVPTTNKDSTRRHAALAERPASPRPAAPSIEGAQKGIEEETIALKPLSREEQVCTFC